MVSLDRAGIDRALLPPSPRAASYHGRRAFHQMNVWRKLSDNEIDPTKLGLENQQWEVLSNYYGYQSRYPLDILKIIRCG